MRRICFLRPGTLGICLVLFLCALSDGAQIQNHQQHIPVDATVANLLETRAHTESHLQYRHTHHKHHNSHRFAIHKPMPATISMVVDDSTTPSPLPNWRVGSTNDISGKQQSWFQKRVADIQELRAKHKPPAWNANLNRPPGLPVDTANLRAKNDQAKLLWERMVQALREKKYNVLSLEAEVTKLEKALLTDAAGVDNIRNDVLPSTRHKLKEAEHNLATCKSNVRKCAEVAKGNFSDPSQDDNDTKAVAWAKKTAPSLNSLLVTIPDPPKITPDEPNETHDSTFNLLAK